MKKILLASLFAFVLSSCGSGSKHTADESYGQKVDTSGAITVQDMLLQLNGKSEMACKVQGMITEVCQAEGCWFKLDKGNTAALLVRMKEHSFAVPRDIAGKTAIVEGTVQMDTISVETLRDYAKDAGKSADEIAAITEPGIEVVVEATGVQLR